MQFAVPTRNHRSSPFLFANVSRQLTRRRRPLYLLLGFAALVVLVLRVFGGGGGSGLGIGGARRPNGEPEAILVTLLDREKYSAAHIERVLENRREYAAAHGYGLFIRNITDYDVGKNPLGWTRIPAMRDAMSHFPHSSWFWFLEQNALIMNPALSLSTHITEPQRLGTLMRRDIPIVPPDSVIHTYRHTPPERVHFILTQDHDGLNCGSWLLKSGDWGRFFLDVWMDPLYKGYGFQRAEQMALEHIVQWHPTILTKLALVAQKVVNSYPTLPGMEGSYEEGDFVVHLQGCEKEGRNCERELEKFWERRGRVGNTGAKVVERR